MCYSFESSFHNWILGFVLAIVTITIDHSKETIWLVFFSLTFLHMQILETIIWKTIKYDKKNIRSLGKYIIPLLWDQPVVNCLMCYYATRNVSSLIFGIVILMILVKQTLKYFKNPNENYIDIGEHSHLGWKQYENNKRILTLGNNLRYLYLIGLIASLFLIKISLILYAIISVIYSLKKRPTDDFTSMWCGHKMAGV